MKMYHLNHLIPHKESPLISFAHENDTPPLIPSTSKQFKPSNPRYSPGQIPLAQHLEGLRQGRTASTTKSKPLHAFMKETASTNRVGLSCRCNYQEAEVGRTRRCAGLPSWKRQHSFLRFMCGSMCNPYGAVGQRRQGCAGWSDGGVGEDAAAGIRYGG